MYLPNVEGFAPHSGFQQNVVFSASSSLLAAGGSEVHSKLLVQSTALLSLCHGMASMAQSSFLLLAVAHAFPVVIAVSSRAGLLDGNTDEELHYNPRFS